MKGFSLRWLSKGGCFPILNSMLLVKAVLYNPGFGKKLVQVVEFPKEGREWVMECVGLAAAALGDRARAKNAFEYLKTGNWFDQLQAGKIAAALGNISEAEDMVLRVYQGIPFATRIEGERLYSDSLGNIIGSVVRQDSGRRKDVGTCYESGYCA